MLFNINKQKSMAFIKLFVTAVIIFVPAFLNLISFEAAVNMMFVISSIVFLMHLKANEKLNISFSHIICVLLIAFSIISLIWVDNRSGQFTYIFAIALIGIFGSIFKAYFADSNDNYFKRRMSYLFSISGIICAFYNFLYWITEIVPVAKNESLFKGLGTEDSLGIFCVISFISTLSLFRGNSKFRKVLFAFGVILVTFCFFMTKSVIAWVFAVAFITLNIFNKKTKSNDKKFIQMLVVAFVYILALLILFFNSENGKVFCDVCSYATGKLFGAGGGFITEIGNFSVSSPIETYGVGLFPYLFASSGLFGILVCVILIGRSVLFFVKNKTIESAVGFILMFSTMFLPLGNGISNILLVTGIDIYNEYSFGSGSVVEINKIQLNKIMIAGMVIVVLLSAATILSFIEMKANTEFKNENYQSSYELSKIVTTIDIFDSDCNRIAAASIRHDKNLLKEKKNEALAFIDDAIDNDSNNIANYEEKAQIYLSCGEYGNAADQYRLIISKTVVNDKYKLALTNVLYKVVENNEKGSSETKRAYEEIVKIAQSTENLEIREKIMNLADKALVYTKGELSSEQENILE